MIHGLLPLLTGLALPVVLAQDPRPVTDGSSRYVCQTFLVGRPPSSHPGPRLWLLRRLLGLRYRYEIRGLDDILARGRDNIILVQNHPGLLDALHTLAATGHKLAARPVMTVDMARGRLGGAITAGLESLNGFLIPNPTEGQTDAALTRVVVNHLAKEVGRGPPILVFGSGAAQRSGRERLAGRGLIKMMLDQAPEARLVLVRETGAWGSDFGHGSPRANPRVELASIQILLRAAARVPITILGNLFVFLPKRTITLEFFEPEDFPRHGTREEMNAYLEKFYAPDERPEPRTFTRRFFWQGWLPALAIGPEIDYGSAYKKTPARGDHVGDVNEVTLATVLDLVRERLNSAEISADQDLDAAGMNSLDSKDIESAVERAFGIWLPAGSVFSSARDLAALIESYSTAAPKLNEDESSPSIEGSKDRLASLAREIARLPGERIGVLASATPDGSLLRDAVRSAGKSVVIINPTGEPSRLDHVLIARADHDSFARHYDLTPYLDDLVIVNEVKTEGRFLKGMSR